MGKRKSLIELPWVGARTRAPHTAYCNQNTNTNVMKNQPESYMVSLLLLISNQQVKIVERNNVTWRLFVSIQYDLLPLNNIYKTKIRTFPFGVCKYILTNKVHFLRTFTFVYFVSTHSRHHQFHSPTPIIT